jgi:hypothetical protein
MPRDRSERRQIFISYRHSDAQPSAGRLADDLRDYFGPEQIYRDIDSTRSGQDFMRQIQEALEGSRAVIVVLGPQWLSSRYPDGRRRLDDPEDPLRLEVEQSLARGIAVVPVLIDNATVPPAGELPTSLRTLVQLDAHRMSDEHWAYDFGRLVETLERHGVVPSASATETVPTDVKQALTSVKRYERSLQASRSRAYTTLVSAVELLRYPKVKQNSESAQIIFTVWEQAITAKVIDAGPGRSKVVLEFTDVRTSAAGAALLAGGVVAGLATGGVGCLVILAALPLVGALQRRFAVGFLQNVQRLLEGRGIGEDSSVLPGVNKWRKRSREV